MKYLLRPYRTARRGPALIVAGALVLSSTLLASSVALAQTGALTRALNLPSLLHSSAQGYMGVMVGDMDAEAAARLKVKDAHGALVTLIDHDAPAAQAGIRINDVIVEINGKRIENSEQFTRLLRELPAGRTASVVISRDGALQTLAVQLVDRKKMEHDVWNKLDSGNDGIASAPAMGILSNGGSSADVPSGGFHMPFFGSTLNVGALVEPLTTQMAEYLGIKAGLMVKQVARKSEAEAAGIKAFDVILKVGTETIATTADWDRTLRANQNKAVQVTVLRDRRQQTIMLQVDSHHHRSSRENASPDGAGSLVAAASPAAPAPVTP